MIITRGSDGKHTARAPGALTENAPAWIDLCKPTAAEAQQIKVEFGIDVPSLHEISELESTVKLGPNDQSLYINVVAFVKTDPHTLDTAPLMLIFLPVAKQLITVRYDEFPLFEQRSQSAPHVGAEAVLIYVLDSIVERTADAVEFVRHDLEALSSEIFPVATVPRRIGPERGYRAAIARLGHVNDLVSEARASLFSLERAFSLLAQGGSAHNGSLQKRLAPLREEVTALVHHVEYVTKKVAFQLSAVLGLINIEQNAIIKIFSVAAVIFLPPTLIASIYGMNFSGMPELHWPFGYAYALVAMALAAILPYLYSKWRGWL